MRLLEDPEGLHGAERSVGHVGLTLAEERLHRVGLLTHTSAHADEPVLELEDPAGALLEARLLHELHVGELDGTLEDLVEADHHAERLELGGDQGQERSVLLLRDGTSSHHVLETVDVALDVQEMPRSLAFGGDHLRRPASTDIEQERVALALERDALHDRTIDQRTRLETHGINSNSADKAPAQHIMYANSRQCGRITKG